MQRNIWQTTGSGVNIFPLWENEQIPKKHFQEIKKKINNTNVPNTSIPKMYLMLLCPNAELMIRVTAYSEKTTLFPP